MIQRPFLSLRTGTAIAAMFALCASAQAGVIGLTVTVQNLAPVNSVSFAPSRRLQQRQLRRLQPGRRAGHGADHLGGRRGCRRRLQAALAAADPTATRGTIGGLLLPGATSSLTFRVDTALNPFFGLRRDGGAEQ